LVKFPSKDLPQEHQRRQDGSSKIDSTFQRVWIKDSLGIHQKAVKVGIDDDLNAQIIQGLNEGEEVVTAMNSSTKFTTNTNSSAQSSSPFMPRPPSRSNTSKKTSK
jgi:hypothetical protein